MLSLSDFKNKMQSLGTSDAPLDAPVETFWCFESTSPLDQLWGYLSDTSRFNRELGLAPRTETEVNGKRLIQTTLLGFKQEWVEEPWTWIQGKVIRANRTYNKGMAKSVQAAFYVDSETDPAKRRIYVYFGWTPAHAGWGLFLTATDNLIRKKFAETFAKMDKFVEANRETSEAQNAFVQKPEISLQSLQALAEGQAALLELGLDEGCVTKLCEWIAQGDDVDLEAIKVKALARKWNVNERDLLITCLHATRSSLLSISWRVICPHCRASRFAAKRLGDIPEAESCDACEIDFTTDTADAIEVVFNVHASIRGIPNVQFCASEPAKKSHIKISQLLKPTTRVALTAELPDGFYRLRFSGSTKMCRLIVSQDAEQNSLALQGTDLPEMYNLASPISLTYTNQTTNNQTFTVEQLWWEDTVVKPAQVFGLPEFRDLFSDEHLKSGVRLLLGDQAILFTDIVGSTDFYEAVGDAKAFAEVNAHFNELYDEVTRHRGIVVKTIGDAIMASFGSAEDALRAAVSIQTRFHPDRSDTTIRLRCSVHVGSVIAVHLNTGIDYFGNTVNFAAKLQACANGGEIAMSETVYRKFVETFARERTFLVDKRVNSRGTTKPVPLQVVKVWASNTLSKAS